MFFCIQDNAYWWFVNVCTTGHWQMTRYSVGEHVSRGNNEEKHALKWFVRYVKEAINERAAPVILTCATVGRAYTCWQQVRD